MKVTWKMKNPNKSQRKKGILDNLLGNANKRKCHNTNKKIFTEEKKNINYKNFGKTVKEKNKRAGTVRSKTIREHRERTLACDRENSQLIALEIFRSQAIRLRLCSEMLVCNIFLGTGCRATRECISFSVIIPNRFFFFFFFFPRDDVHFLFAFWKVQNAGEEMSLW